MRLLAEDADGLKIVAAAVQDALARPQDLAFNRTARSFGALLNRFQWEKARARGPWFRARAVLAFGGVLAVRSQRLPRGVDEMLSLLDVTFASAQTPPAGTVRLIFAGGAEIQLDVECLDVSLADTGPSWPSRRKPDHDAAPDGETK